MQVEKTIVTKLLPMSLSGELENLTKLSSIQEILQQQTSYQQNAWAPISQKMSITDVLDAIKGGVWADRVNSLRTLLKNGQIEDYDFQKRTLPAVTFCGTFSEKRRREYLQSYNHVIVIDIDKLNVDELQRVRNILLSDYYVFAHWLSPSAKGFKGLVGVHYNQFVDKNNVDSLHKEAFQRLSNYFQHTYQIALDESGSDTTRLCFLSFDNLLGTKAEMKWFECDVSTETIVSKMISATTRNTYQTITREILYNPKEKNWAVHRKTIQSILRFLTKKQLSITGSYDEWYRVALAIANSFTYDLGEKYFLSLSKLDGIRYNEASSIELLKYCYANGKGEIKFNTILFYAIQKGYISNSQKSVVPKAPVRDDGA